MRTRTTYFGSSTLRFAMDRMIIPILVAASALLTAVVVDYIAHNDLGATQESIRIEALILAAVLGIGLAAGSVIRKRSK